MSALLKEMVKIPLLDKLVVKKLGELPKSRSECDPNHFGLLVYVRTRGLRAIPLTKKLDNLKIAIADV